MSTIATQRITVALPKTLLTQLDAIVPARERSQFITRAIEEQLAILSQVEVVDETAGIWKDEDYPYLRDEAAMNEWLSQLRSGWQRPIG
ncbi:MAG: hypothetical protein KJ063_20075 [Anaerolineae bacterium]|nr:hypothetical protein [Anaerolineae bacterium]